MQSQHVALDEPVTLTHPVNGQTWVAETPTAVHDALARGYVVDKPVDEPVDKPAAEPVDKPAAKAARRSAPEPDPKAAAADAAPAK